MAIFYTDTASLGKVDISGSGNILNVVGSGSAIFVVSGSGGTLFEISDSSGEDLFAVASSSIDILKVTREKVISVSGSLQVTGSITGSLFGTSSFSNNSISSSYALTSSFALNAGGGSGFPFSGTAVITGSIVLTSGSGFPGLLASETLAAGDFVNIHSGGVRKASSNDVLKQAHGFVTSSAVATNPVIVFYSGLNTQVTGLIAGSRYFLSTNGSESTIAATTGIYQEVGVAISSNALLVNLGPSIIR